MSLKSKFVLLALFASWIAMGVRPAPAEVVKENHLFPDFCPEDLNFSWFEPIYCDCGDERPAANVGFFFEYERTSLNFSRPNQTSGTDIGDWTNGNVFDFGYMRDSDHHGKASGWLVSAMKIDNPGITISNFNESHNGNILVDLLGNDVGETNDSLNEFNVYGLEINRVWRMEPTFHGHILEPFVGVRYIRFRDHFDFISFVRADPIPTVGPANSVVTVDQFDIYTNSETFTDNDLYGGQLGLRTFRRRGRWRVGAQVKGFSFHNFAARTRDDIVTSNDADVFATYDANGNLSGITIPANGVTTEIERSEQRDLRNMFVWGGELRLDLGFDITKMFAIEVGGQFMAMSDGIGRGNQLFSGENLLSGGASLGFSINR